MRLVRVMWQNPQSVPAGAWPCARLSELFAMAVSKDAGLLHPGPAPKSLMLDLILCCGHLEVFNNFWTKDPVLSFCMMSCKLDGRSCFHPPRDAGTAGRALGCPVADNVDRHFINGWKVNRTLLGNVREHILQRTLCHPCLLSFDSPSS